MVNIILYIIYFAAKTYYENSTYNSLNSAWNI